MPALQAQERPRTPPGHAKRPGEAPPGPRCQDQQTPPTLPHAGRTPDRRTAAHAPPRWTGRNHRPRPHAGDRPHAPRPQEGPPRPQARTRTNYQTTPQKLRPGPAERPTLPKTGPAHIHLIYSKAAPAPVARISSASLPKRPGADQPGGPAEIGPARTPGRNARTGSAAPAPAPLALPEISTSDRTSRPGRRTPCRPESTPDRRTPPAARAGQLHRDRLPPSPLPPGPPSPPSPEIVTSSAPDALPPVALPRSAQTGPGDKTYKNHALKLYIVNKCP